MKKIYFIPKKLYQIKYSFFKKSERFQEGGLVIKKKFYKLNKYPKISIITVVFNNQKHIQKTFNSIFSQTYKNFELIVIDGASTDNTLNIIKKNENKIHYWMSEKDNGIYDAFNKGLCLASGDFIGFVNSDDILMPNALEILKQYINQNPNIDFFFGAVKKHWGILHGYKPWKIKFSWGFYSSHSTGFYIKRSSAKKVGFYNIKYKYSADYDYLYRMIVKHKMLGKASKKSELFGIFNRGGFSSKISFSNHFKEEIQIRKDNNQSAILIQFLKLYKTIRHFKKLYLN